MDDNIFDEYFESSFKHGNILNKKSFDNQASFYERMYKDVLSDDKNTNILDYGCGCGHFLYYLNKNGYENIYGIDISSQQIDYCRENIIDKVETVDGLKFLEEKNEEYDYIVSHDVVEHIPKDKVMLTLKLMHKALKKGGCLIVRVPNMSNPFSLDSRYSDFTHECGYTSKSLYQIFWITGFREIQILPPIKIPIRSFPNLVRWILQYLFRQIMKFIYYFQDFAIPKNYDKNLVVVGVK